MNNKKFCEHCWELLKNCICKYKKCSKCWKSYSNWDSENQIYEYRWILSCWKCKDEVEKTRDFERQEIIQEENHKTQVFKWLDMWDSIIWKANRQILKRHIEIASKESWRLKKYEWR